MLLWFVCIATMIVVVELAYRYVKHHVFYHYEYHPDDDPAGVVAEFRILYFNGKIEKGALKKIIHEFNSSQFKIIKFSISSWGGDTSEGLRIANFIMDHDLAVEVRGDCFSSCANYIFPAGSEKILHEDSILGWHGGAFSPPEFFSYTVDGKELKLAEKRKRMKEEIFFKEWRSMESAFFKRVGTSYMLPVCGQLQKLSPYLVYYYSAKDLKKFGIANIRFIDGEKEWEAYQKSESINFKLARYCA